MNRYHEYERAAKRVSQHWVQGQWQTHDGGVCLMGALGATRETYRLSPEVANDVHRRLRRYPSYWFGCFLGALGAPLADSPIRERAIAFWNDAPWRQRETVVRVLGDLANGEKPKWLESEVLRLSIEVSSLRERIKELEVRVALGEAENRRLWNRILGTQFSADKYQLEELEEELREKSARMDELAQEKA